MTLSASEIRRYQEFVWALQELMIDLRTPVDVYFVMTVELPKLESEGLIEITIPQPPAERKISLNRFIIFPIVNSLCKLLELCYAYGKEIHGLPKAVTEPLMEVIRTLESRDVYDFRNTYTAHILCIKSGQKKRPLTLQESLDALQRVTGIEKSGELFHREGFKNYLKWIHRSDGPCVVSWIYDVILAVDRKIGGIPKRMLDD